MTPTGIHRERGTLGVQSPPRASGMKLFPMSRAGVERRWLIRVGIPVAQLRTAFETRYRLP
jgi:hypothetical protein